MLRRCQCGELQVIRSDIVCDRTLSGLFLIDAEVHVRRGARLTIEPGSVVFFKNGPLADVDAGALPYASLVIDSGASIVARDVDFKNQQDVANNTGGLIIVGTNAASIAATTAVYQPGTYNTVVADASVTRKRSSLRDVRFTNLGNTVAQLSALTLFQTRDNDDEVRVRGLVYVNGSGDDGVAIFGGSRTWERLSVNNALSAGVALDYSAVLAISGELVITTGVLAAAVRVCTGAFAATNRLDVLIGAKFTARAAVEAQGAGACFYTFDGTIFTAPFTDPLYESTTITGSPAFIQAVFP